jgi:hypothetical protein
MACRDAGRCGGIMAIVQDLTALRGRTMFLPLFARWYPSQSSNRRGARARRARQRTNLENLENRELLTPTVYTVTDPSDEASDTNSLRYAVIQADADINPAGSVIRFDPLVFSVPRTITLSSTLDLTGKNGPIVIDGPGAALLTVSGQGAVRVFDVGASVTTTISDLTISDGWTSDSGAGDAQGGGLFNGGGTVVLSGTVVSDNRAVGDFAISGPGLGGDGGGIAQLSGHLTLTGDTINGNQAVGGSGLRVEALPGYSGGPGLGGGLYVGGGSVIILNSTFAGNAASGGAGGAGNSTYAGQEAGLDGGSGGAGSGGGLFVAAGTLTLVNSTLAGNVVTGGPGGAAGGADSPIGPIIGFPGLPGAATGGGLDDTGGSVTLGNTIVVNNTASSLGPTHASDIAAAVRAPVTGSFNLIGAGGAGGVVGGADGNLVGVADAGLGSLADNGGLTPTMALLPGSPAIASGSVGLAVDPLTGQPLVTDQRGPGYARTYNGAVDIGAFEVQPAVVARVVVGWGVQTATLQTAPDGLRLLPPGRSTDLPWLGIDAIAIDFNHPPASFTVADVTIQSLRGIKYGPVTISGSPTSPIITFARAIESADRVTITIAAPDIAIFMRRIDVLPGDFVDKGVVTSNDATDIKNEWKRKHGATPTIFGEILGDGTVDARDYKAARKFAGTRLPKLTKSPGKPPKVVLPRVLVREHIRVDHHG